jgi:uncharacterized protein (DUF4415 family)
MEKNSTTEKEPWIDPDDAPEWTQEMFRMAAVYKGGKLIRPATGTLTQAMAAEAANKAKEQVTLRLDPDVIEKFQAMGDGWQSRINAELRKALGI